MNLGSGVSGQNIAQCEPPQPVSNLQRSIEILERMIGNLEQVTVKLNEKLNPMMKPDFPRAVSSDKEKKMNSPLVEATDLFGQRVGNQVIELNHILRRLDF